MSFFETTTGLINKQHQDLGINADEVRVKISFDLNDVNIVRESINDDCNIDGIFIFFKNGNSYFIYEEFDSFMNILNDFRNGNKQSSNSNM